MADVVAKIKSGNAIINGRAVVYVPHLGSLYQAGGYSSGLYQVPMTIAELETQYTNRFDEDGGPPGTVNTFDTRSQVIGNTQVALTGIADATNGWQLKASAANTGTLYIGPAPTVTANTDAGTDGFPLAAGEGLFVPVNNTGVIYAISTVPNEKIFVMVV